MLRSLLIILTFTLQATAAEEFGTIGEAFSLRQGQEFLEIGARQHTAPSLTEFGNSGIMVESMEVYPTEIRIAVGEAYAMRQLQVFTYGPDGVLQEDVPLSLALQGPPGLLDFEAWRMNGENVIGAKAGTGTIWVESLAPSSSGRGIRRSIQLVVY